MKRIELQNNLIAKLAKYNWKNRIIVVNGLTFDLTRYKGTDFPKYWFLLNKDKINQKLIPFVKSKYKTKTTFLEWRLLIHGNEISNKVRNKILLAKQLTDKGLIIWYVRALK